MQWSRSWEFSKYITRRREVSLRLQGHRSTGEHRSDHLEAHGREMANIDRVGPNEVFDGAATQPTIDLGIEAVRNGGTFYTYGTYHQKVYGYLKIGSMTDLEADSSRRRPSIPPSLDIQRRPSLQCC